MSEPVLGYNTESLGKVGHAVSKVHKKKHDIYTSFCGLVPQTPALQTTISL